MANESRFQGEELPMPNIKQFADIILSGAYDHVLPRPSDKDALSIRQIAASYPEMLRAASRDDTVAATAVALPTFIVIAIIMASILVRNELPAVVSIMSTLLVMGLTFLVTAILVMYLAKNFQWHSSRKMLNETDVLLLQIRDDMNTLAKCIGFANYESLKGYDRKILTSMAHEAGAQMYASSKHLMNSDDSTERQAAERFRMELDEFHTLLGRLGLQPKVGYPAYGRLAAEAA